jgi:parallel beta-helix repeat protein
VDHNIVVNAIGAPDGTTTSNTDAHGIYMDDNSSQVTISNNTVANCGGAGLFLHADHDITIVNNTFFNNALTTANVYAQIYHVFPGAVPTAPVRNLKVTGNKFISKQADQIIAYYKTNEANMSQWPFGLTNANWNGNYYARPVNEDATTFQLITAGGTTNTNLPGWTSASGALLDNTSNISPITLADPADIRFEYNATNDPVTVSLGADNYIDVVGIAYTGDITLGAWESLVLFLTDEPTIPPIDISQIIIDFTPCDPMPEEGYQILYRVVGDTAYIDAGFFTTSPAVIPVDYPAGTFFEGVIKSACGDVPWSGGGGSGGGGCVPVSVLSITLPDGESGIPYSYSVPLDPSWTTPIDLTVITAPSWMTIAIVGTDIVFSGTPDTVGTDVSVQFTLANDCGTVEIDTAITVPCTAVTIEAGDLPNAYLDNPYSYSLTLSGSGPFALGAVTKPAWMTITIVDDQLIFSGTPTTGDDGTGIAVSVEVTNDCGTDTFADTLDVIELPAFRIDHFRSFVSGSFSRVSMTSLDAMDGYVVWGDGAIEAFSIGAFTPHNFDHTYTSLGNFACKFYFTTNTRIIQFVDLFEGDYVYFFSHSDNFTNFCASVFGPQLSAVVEIADCLPPAASHICGMSYTAHSTSTMVLVDFGTLVSFCKTLSVYNFPELQYIINLPATLTSQFSFSGNQNLYWVDGGGAAALPQAVIQQINGNGSIPAGWAYRDGLQLGTCTNFLFDQNFYTSGDIDSFLLGLDANGLSGGTAIMNGQSPAAPPSGTGATAKANLIGKGWTVTTD